VKSATTAAASLQRRVSLLVGRVLREADLAAGQLGFALATRSSEILRVAGDDIAAWIGRRH
jgi:hypothetical protein